MFGQLQTHEVSGHLSEAQVAQEIDGVQQLESGLTHFQFL